MKIIDLAAQALIGVHFGTSRRFMIIDFAAQALIGVHFGTSRRFMIIDFAARTSGTCLGLTRMPDSERQLTSRKSDRASAASE